MCQPDRWVSRYKQIVENLKSEQTLSYLSFGSFVAQESERFLISCQSSEPLIHILYEGMCTLLLNFLIECIKKKYLFEKENGILSRKSMLAILNIDLRKLKYQKLICLVDIGTKANYFFFK